MWMVTCPTLTSCESCFANRMRHSSSWGVHMEGKFNSDYSINIVPCTVLTFGGVCHVLWSKLNGLFGATLLLNLTGKHRNGVLSQLVQATLPSPFFCSLFPASSPSPAAACAANTSATCSESAPKLQGVTQVEMKQGTVVLNYPPHLDSAIWSASFKSSTALDVSSPPPCCSTFQQKTKFSFNFLCLSSLYTQLTAASSLRRGTSSQCLGPYAALHNSTAYIHCSIRKSANTWIKFSFWCDGKVSCTFWKHSLASPVFPCLEHSLLVLKVRYYLQQE